MTQFNKMPDEEQEEIVTEIEKKETDLSEVDGGFNVRNLIRIKHLTKSMLDFLQLGMNKIKGPDAYTIR